MGTSVGSGSAWKDFLGGTGGKGTSIGVSGAWKSIPGMWVGVGGVWKKFFTAFNVSLSDVGTISTSVFTTSGSEATATAGIRFDTDGQAEHRSGFGGTTYENYANAWGRPLTTGVGSEYTVRMTVNSGDGPSSGPALDTDHALSSLRTWELSVTGEVVNAEGSWTATIKKGGVTVATATFTIIADVTV